MARLRGRCRRWRWRGQHALTPTLSLCRPGTSWTRVRRHGGHIQGRWRNVPFARVSDLRLSLWPWRGSREPTGVPCPSCADTIQGRGPPRREGRLAGPRPAPQSGPDGAGDGAGRAGPARASHLGRQAGAAGPPGRPAAACGLDPDRDPAAARRAGSRAGGRPASKPGSGSSTRTPTPCGRTSKRAGPAAPAAARTTTRARRSAWPPVPQRTATVRAHLLTAFQRYGLPDRLLVDNGSPWGNHPAHPYTPLTSAAPLGHRRQP